MGGWSVWKNRLLLFYTFMNSSKFLSEAVFHFFSVCIDYIFFVVLVQPLALGRQETLEIKLSLLAEKKVKMAFA